MCHAGESHLGLIIIMCTSPCLTAAPLLYEDIKTHTAISKFNYGKLHQIYPDVAFTKFAARLAVSVPVEELLCEAVLHVAGRGLLLDPSLQQHLLVHLPLLLLLLQVLLHAKTLPIELLILLCRVTKLRNMMPLRKKYPHYMLKKSL